MQRHIGRNLQIVQQQRVPVGRRARDPAGGDMVAPPLTFSTMKFCPSFSENFGGYRLGAGGQLTFSGKAYVGAEYRYSNYEQGLARNQVALTVLASSASREAGGMKSPASSPWSPRIRRAPSNRLCRVLRKRQKPDATGSARRLMDWRSPGIPA
jgi:hypothetical protein